MMNENTHIFELELSTRANNALLSYSVYENGTWKHEPLDTIGKLIKKSDIDLIKAPNLGRKSLNEIIYALDERGLKLFNYKVNIKLPKKIPMRELNLRDYFAAKAMQGMLVNRNDAGYLDKMPKICYQWADAMMEARGK